MWLPLLGLILGVALGILTDIQIPTVYENYLSIAVLAALDTMFGGIRAHLQQVYDDKVFISGFFFNIALAAGLAFLGVHIRCRFIFSCDFCIWCTSISKYCRHSHEY